MKRKLSPFAALIAAVAFIPFSGYAGDGTANLVKNPSFEEVNPDGTPVNWVSRIRKHEKDPGKQATAQFKLTDDAQDGKKAATIVAPEPNPDRSLNMAEWYQDVEVKPNQQYFLSVWMKAKLRCGWPNASVEQLTKSTDYAKNVPKDTKSLAELSDKEKPGEYNLYELKFKTGPDTEVIRISLRFQDMGAGTVSFDNVSLIELDKTK